MVKGFLHLQAGRSRLVCAAAGWCQREHDWFTHESFVICQEPEVAIHPMQKATWQCAEEKAIAIMCSGRARSLSAAAQPAHHGSPATSTDRSIMIALLAPPLLSQQRFWFRPPTSPGKVTNLESTRRVTGATLHRNIVNQQLRCFMALK